MIDVTSFIEKKEGWVKTKHGAYSDVSQQMPWEDILNWQIKMFLYSCYLYYKLDDPKLTDDHFDGIVRIMEQNYTDLPDRIKSVCGDQKKIKPCAYIFADLLTEEEKQEAMEWKNERVSVERS